VNETYFMLFGVSIYCQGGRVARDSVAIARSTDGIDWQFWKYLIEADARACKQSRNEWTDDEENPFTYQVNDPAAYFNPNNTQEILVFYTTVKNYQDNFGHIGLAKFDKSWNLKFRNDYFIEGSRALGGPGYSRPTVNWKENGGPRLYFDSTFTGINKIGSIRLDNLDQLKNPEVRDERTGGIDIEIQELRLGEVLLLSGGIWARERRLGGEWGPLFYPIPLSGEAWDKDGQGSPQVFLNDNCELKIYLSGTVMNAKRDDYEVINIGMVWPKNKVYYNFDSCMLRQGDAKIDLVDFGIWKTEYLPGTKNRADFNKDGSVNLVDFGIWKREYLN